MQLVVGGAGLGRARRWAAEDNHAGTRRGRKVAAPAVTPPPERTFGERPPRLGVPLSEIAVLDADGRIVEVNEAWRTAVAASGRVTPHNAGVGSLYLDVAGRALAEPDRLILGLALQRLLLGDADQVDLTCAAQAPDGRHWRHVQITPLSVGAAGRFVAIHHDHTGHARTQEALQVTSEELLHARDEERQRIAIELHDSTSQHLAAIGLWLAKLERTRSTDGPTGVILEEIRRSLNEAARETRALSYLLKPRGLGRHGLSATVQQFLEGFARRTGLEATLRTDAAVDAAPEPIQHAALRIVQEALLNANRHAEAHSVSVVLGVADGLLTVSIADDGRGMRSTDPDDPGHGVGIPGMRARAQQFCGDLAISSDETGTRVTAMLPLA